jgi:uncharacterized protein YjbI with pentapeptide repeats
LRLRGPPQRSQWSCQKRPGLIVLFLLVLAALAVPAAARTGVGLHPIRSTALERRLAAGKAVELSRVRVVGELRFPAHVSAPVVLRDSLFAGRILARSSSFENLLDLSGSSFASDANFSEARFGGPVLLARTRTSSRSVLGFDFTVFDGPAVFTRAQIHGPVSFAGTQFGSSSRFDLAHFNRNARFGFAIFGDLADFQATTFAGTASFRAVEFRSVADFSDAQFDGNATFDGARFSAATDFSGGYFLPSGRMVGSPASFRFVHFAEGASFRSRAFGRGVVFDGATASGPLGFQGTIFQGDASFDTVDFSAEADFSQAELNGLVNFEQARLARLDFDGAVFNESRLVLPNDRNHSGRLDDLRMDPNDVRYVYQGTQKGARKAREHAFALVEKAARSGGDLGAAAEAGVRRRTLGRQDDDLPLHVLDWAFYWQIAGYFQRPLHPLYALVALFLLGVLVRLAWRAGARDGWAHLRGLLQDIRESLGSIFGKGKGLVSSGEALLAKVLLAVLILCVANVWPPVSDLLKGVLP